MAGMNTQTVVTDGHDSSEAHQSTASVGAGGVSGNSRTGGRRSKARYLSNSGSRQYINRAKKACDDALAEIEEYEITTEVYRMVFYLRLKEQMTVSQISYWLKKNPDCRYWRTVGQVRCIVEHFNVAGMVQAMNERYGIA